MKKLFSKARLLLAGLTLLLVLSSCQKEKQTNQPQQASANAAYRNLSNQINALPLGALSDAEREWLIWLREEEKLARDVYKVMYTKWNQNIFNNIAASEQTHMDVVALLLQRYSIPDPASPVAGVFNNPVLQQLYTDLVNTGNSNMIAAYTTGATIEDVDLYDLGRALAANDNQDIQLVLENLQKGSRNHLRSFYKNLVNAGVIYTAQYITQAELDQIISTPMETGY